MKLRIEITVESDIADIAEGMDNSMRLATNIPGVDESSIKQEFLVQAESFIRVISDTQIPALYAAVLEREKRTALEHDPGAMQSDAHTAVQDKLQAIRARQRGEWQEQDLPGLAPDATTQEAQT